MLPKGPLAKARGPLSFEGVFAASFDRASIAIEWGMRKLILIVVALVPAVAAAEQKNGPRKKAAETPKVSAPVSANPCAQYGAGFVQVQGTSTCVKLSGSVRVDVGTGR
jgi:hypothetical protein